MASKRLCDKAGNDPNHMRVRHRPCAQHRLCDACLGRCTGCRAVNKDYCRLCVLPRQCFECYLARTNSLLCNNCHVCAIHKPVHYTLRENTRQLRVRAALSHAARSRASAMRLKAAQPHV